MAGLTDTGQYSVTQHLAMSVDTDGLGKAGISAPYS